MYVWLFIFFSLGGLLTGGSTYQQELPVCHLVARRRLLWGRFFLGGGILEDFWTGVRDNPMNQLKTHDIITKTNQNTFFTGDDFPIKLGLDSKFTSWDLKIWIPRRKLRI